MGRPEQIGIASAPAATAAGDVPDISAGTPGQARLRLKAEGGIADLYHAQPLRLLFPRAEPGDVFQAAIACVAGGLVAGDRHEIEVHLEPGAKAMVIGQAAEKIYRSTGATCAVDAQLSLADGAWLEWLPQETILFDHARLRRLSRASLARDARLLAGGMLVFGRAAKGEMLTEGLVHDAWEIKDLGGRLRWKDVLHMEGDLAGAIGNRATFEGARASATLLYAASDAEKFLPLARAVAARLETPRLRIAATLVNGLLVTRFLGAEALALRNAFAGLWCALRHAAAGLPLAMPRLWTV